MGMLKEFKEFAMRGNVVDMAVGIIIGAGFGKIVSSLVADVVTPPLGWLIDGVDFSRLSLTLAAPIGNTAPVVIAYGRFIQSVFDFSIIAFTVFLLIQGIQKLRRKEEAKPPPPAPPAAPTKDQELLMEIRDLLRNR